MLATLFFLMVGVVNEMIGASAIAIHLGVTLDHPLAVAAIAGIALLAVSVVLCVRPVDPPAGPGGS